MDSAASTAILYVSTNPSPREFSRIRRSLRPGVEEVTYGMPEASHKFHNAIAQGFASNNCVVHAFSPRPISHRFHKGWFWESSREVTDADYEVFHPWTVNFPVVKQVVHSLQLIMHVLNWRRKSRKFKNRIVFVDAAYVTGYPFVLAVTRFSSVKVIASFADVYSYMADVDDALQRKVGLVEKCARRIMRACIDTTDGYVVITEAINQLINRGEKPFVVVEGIASLDAEALVSGKPPTKQSPTVLYAGALRKEYGLEDLIRGFVSYDNPGAVLVIYGSGDYADDIVKHAEHDKRIDYRGRAPLLEVLEEERSAWLLVNPRPTTHEFTRYSFPSKNIEYLQSGTALLTTRLPGMPSEYYDFVYTIDGYGGADEINHGIARCLGLGLDALNQTGQLGRDFVLREKNPEKQSARMLDLIKRIA